MQLTAQITFYYCFSITDTMIKCGSVQTLHLQSHHTHTLSLYVFFCHLTNSLLICASFAGSPVTGHLEYSRTYFTTHG